MNIDAKRPEDITPEDVGRKIWLIEPHGRWDTLCKVQMMITSPRGKLVIFDTKENMDSKGDAIKSFVEGHKNG